MAETASLDRGLFDPTAIDAETLAFNAQLEATLATVVPPWTRPEQEVRDERESGQGMFGPIVRSRLAHARTIAGVPCRVLLPEAGAVAGVYLHIHGGGWTAGASHHSDVRNERIVQHCNVAVVSVDYRLAPEHPYPAGPDDCEAVAAWLIEHTGAEFGSEKLVIGGESAGGHLAAATLLRLRDRHGYRGFRGANLVYGCYDISRTPSQRRWGERYLVLSDGAIRHATSSFVPDEAQRRDPDVSPLYADLAGLPPALFTIGTLDPLLDDSLFMHARWLAAGNEAEIAVYPGGVHAFDAFPTGLGRRARRRMDEFITRAVSA